MTKESEVKVSQEFKAQTVKAIWAIIFFVITYSIIFLLAAIFACLSVIGGLGLIVAKPMILTLFFGIGLASLGVLVFIFLIKFIFKSHKTDHSHLIEVKESQEPELFKMIHEIVLKVGTGFPRRVYLSADVNAGVFYDSRFWSMFFPAKKNLQIGLGLVNVVTKEELRAILSHEFGHFSQKTMKLGIYVYNVNQVIYDMLFENESYDNLIQRWANVSWLFSIFVVLAIRINMGIQWILRKLYVVVNKNHVGLSREMEFHADEIAASVAGYAPLKKALLRMPLADSTFNYVLDFYYERVSANIKSENLYHDQSALIRVISEENNFIMTNGLPDVLPVKQSRYDKSKLVIKDEWSSHPSIDQRIERVEQTGYQTETESNDLANSVFVNIVTLQELFTDKVFEKVDYPGESISITSSRLIEEYTKINEENLLPKIYNEYYDKKNPITFELDQIAVGNEEISFNELFSDEKVDLIYTAISLEKDLEALEGIWNKSIDVKTFDYDGTNYSRKDVKIIAEKVSAELEETYERVKANDIKIYCFMERIEREQKESQDLRNLYLEFSEFNKTLEAKHKNAIEIQEDLQFVNVATAFAKIKRNFKRIKRKEEILKEDLDKMLQDKFLTDDLTAEIRENAEQYLSQSWTYFEKKTYYEGNLALLYTATNNYVFLLSRKYFRMKKNLLAYQEELIKNRRQ